MIAIDLSIEAGGWPAEAELHALCAQAINAVLADLGLPKPKHPAELSLLFTSDKQIKALNANWRGKDKATNVLAFPAFPPNKMGPLPPLLGDIVLAWETVSAEALGEEKPLQHHISHLVVHGLLHLLGYDHETDGEADEMEAIERRILARLAIPDPYA